jgi:hypothetical protein
VKKILSVSMILLTLFSIHSICKAAAIRGSVMEIHYGAGRAAGAEQVTVTPSVDAGNARIAKQRSKIENEDDERLALHGAKHIPKDL